MIIWLIYEAKLGLALLGIGLALWGDWNFKCNVTSERGSGLEVWAHFNMPSRSPLLAPSYDQRLHSASWSPLKPLVCQLNGSRQYLRNWSPLITHLTCNIKSVKSCSCTKFCRTIFNLKPWNGGNCFCIFDLLTVGCLINKCDCSMWTHVMSWSISNQAAIENKGNLWFAVGQTTEGSGTENAKVYA